MPRPGPHPAHRRRPAPGAGPAEYRQALGAALADPDTDAVVVTAVPTGAPGLTADALAAALRTAIDAAPERKIPVVAAHLAIEGLATALSARGIPGYPSAERAVRALAHAVRHARWRADAADPGTLPAFDDIDEAAAHRIITAAGPPRRPAGTRWPPTAPTGCSPPTASPSCPPSPPPTRTPPPAPPAGSATRSL